MVSDQRPRQKAPRFGLLELDAWIDDTLYRVGAWLQRAWDAYTVFMERFAVRGVTRGAVELLSDGVTFAVLGGLVLCAFARPAFEYTKRDWRSAQEFAVVFLDRAGNEIGRRGVMQNDRVRLDELPDYLIKATLSTEDRRFYEHWGIDVQGTLRAIMENARASGVVQGGSSLTQQLAKNLFLSNERSLERKIKEAFLAIWLEFNMTKDEILKMYLDHAYMGGGAFGVEAASQFYFGKSARDVTLAEAAMLAGLFKAPTRFAPHVNLPAARARANTVLSNLVEAGFLTEGQVWGARRNPASPVPRRTDEAPNYFLDWAFDEVKSLAPAGERVLMVKTTVDTALQRRAEQAIESALRQSGESYRVSQGGLVALDIDGAVRAMVGGRDYGQSQFNRATMVGRQTGSSFKPYVYLLAFMNGYSPTSIVADAPIAIGNWSPRNYSGGFSGRMTLTEALARSINTIPVRLAHTIGRGRVVQALRDMGVTSEILATPSMPLGVADMTVVEQAQAYAHFASGGREVEAHAVLEMTNSRGDVIYRRDRDREAPKQVFPREAVAALNQAMVQVVEGGTGTRAQLDGIQAAGKTGTTQSYRDAWFVGYTGNYTAAVWFGNDDNTVMNRMTGGTLPATVWHEFMSFAHAGIERRGLFGLPDTPVTRVARLTRQAEAEGRPVQGPGEAGARPLALSRRSVEALRRIERRLHDAPPLESPAAPQRVTALPAGR